MKRILMVSCVFMLMALLHNQAAAAALEAHTNLGLALPSSLPRHAVKGQDFAADAANNPSSTYDDEYIWNLEKEELEDVQQMLAEQSMQQPAVAVAKPPSAGLAVSTFKRLPVPFELSAAQPVMAMASTFGEEIRNAVQQAFAAAHKIVNSPSTAKLITASSSIATHEAEPVNIVQLAQSANGNTDIDVTVTIEQPGSTWSLPSMLPNNMFRMFGQESSSDSDSQLELAAEVAQAFIENALTREVSKLGDDQELVLDMTLENAPRQASEKLIAAAAAAAANAARAAVNTQPWETVELQMDIVETTQPFFKSGRFFVFAMLLLTAQLALCFAVTILWTEAEEQEQEKAEDDGRIEYVEIALKPQKQQQQQGEWASMAEEGRGLYEKLLSYT